MAVEGRAFNVGIIGYGLSATVFHIPFIGQTKSLKLHSILQRNPTATSSAPKDHPEIKHFTSLDSFLQDDALDLVVLSTPPNTHSTFARAALNSGKHVLVEKPFVPTSAEADDLVTLARERKRLLCVFQNRRWDADFLTVQHIFRDGTLGRVYEFETHYDRFRPEKPETWKGQLQMKDGGGAVYDLGVHVLDQVFVLFGMPSTVSAKFVNQREGRVVTGEGGDEPDSFTAMLSYSDTGLLVLVRVGVLSTENQQMRFWIRGSKGSYHKTGVDPQEDQLRKEGMKPSDTGFGHEDKAWHGRLCLAQEDGHFVEESRPNVVPETYARFYELLGKALETGREDDLPVPASQAADVLRIIDAIKESAATGRDVCFSS